MKDWKRIEPTNVTKVGYRIITTKTYLLPDGTTTTFDTMWPDGQAFAVVIALTKDKQVVVGRQYRPGPEKYMDEIPGGGVEARETPERAVRREAREETGYELGKVEYLGASHKDAYLNATWHMFLATDCTRVAEQELDKDEQIEVKLISINQLIENAQTDMMTDVTTVMVAYDHLKELSDD